MVGNYVTHRKHFTLECRIRLLVVFPGIWFVSRYMTIRYYICCVFLVCVCRVSHIWMVFPNQGDQLIQRRNEERCHCFHNYTYEYYKILQ